MPTVVAPEALSRSFWLTRSGVARNAAKSTFLRYSMCVLLARHFQDVQASGRSLRRIDGPVLVHIDVVHLGRAEPRARDRGGDVRRDLRRPEGIVDVVDADARVEEGAENDPVGSERGRDGIVLMDVVRAVAAAAR